MAIRVLIADDDQDLIEGLRWYLEAGGFETLTECSGTAALATFRREQPEVVILDVMMPGMDGVQVCEAIRQESDAFILMLSARDGELDRVRALEKGADDYITKPFYASELAARVKAHLRRAQKPALSAASYRWKALEVFLDERRVLVHGATVNLSSTEFDLLVAMLHHPRVVFSREQLVNIIWHDEFFGELRLVDNHVYRLRDKLISAGMERCPIMTIRGVGYAFRPEE